MAARASDFYSCRARQGEETEGIVRRFRKESVEKNDEKKAVFWDCLFLLQAFVSSERGRL